jgi:hypothetical protein
LQKYHYRPGKTTFVALWIGVVGLFSSWIGFNSGGSFWVVIGALCLLAAGKLLMDAMSDKPALAFDAERLQVRTAWGSVAEVHWRAVQHVDIEVMTLRYWGIIPISKNETLLVKCDGGLFGTRRLRLPLKLMDLPSGGSAHLLAMLQSAHMTVVGTGGALMAGAGESSWGTRNAQGLASRAVPAESGFDPDAALARYLARKEAGQEPAAAMPPPVAPARPVFGRKA